MASSITVSLLSIALL